MSGWYAVKRGMLESDLLAPKGPFSRAEAWLWMIENAPYADGEVTIKGKTYPTIRGHVYHSIRFLAAKWRWSEKQVRVFIDQLVEAGAVEKIGAQRGARFGAQLRLCNYDKYQLQGRTKGHTQGHKEEQDKTIPVGAAEKSAASDPVKLMFDSGRELLCGAGKSNAAAGKLLGKWRKEYGTSDVIAAIGNARREGAIDPVSFIEGTLRFRQKRGATAPRADSRTEHAGAFGILREAGV